MLLVTGHRGHRHISAGQAEPENTKNKVDSSTCNSIVMVQRCKQGRQGIRCPTAQDRPYVMKNHILHEVPLLPTKYGGSREENSNKTRNLRCYSNCA
ncbi:hypothetical protein ACLKA7_001987 [Drosophila subpalustris]